MMALEQAAANSLTTIRQTTNAVTQYRDTPLTEGAVEKLDGILAKHFELRMVSRGRVVPVLDKQGHWNGDEWQSYKALDLKSKISEPRRELIEAVLRPAHPAHILIHFRRLSTHLRFNGGGDFKIVLEDLTRDLAEKSEWAIIKACEYFRTETGPWFPLTKTILAKVEEFHNIALRMDGMTESPIVTKKEPVKQKSLNEVAREKDKMPWHGHTLESMPDNIRSSLWQFCLQFQSEDISKIYCRSYGVDFHELKSKAEEWRKHNG